LTTYGLAFSSPPVSSIQHPIFKMDSGEIAVAIVEGNGGFVFGVMLYGENT
jgi:hypothetical protein